MAIPIYKLLISTRHKWCLHCYTGQEIINSVKVNIEKLEKTFNKLKIDTRDHLVVKRDISVTKVVDARTDMPTEECKKFLMKELYKEDDIKALFATMRKCCITNYLSYHLLEHLIKEFELEEEERRMEAYKNDLQMFRETTPLKLFCKTQTKHLIKLSPGFKELVVRFEWPDDITLEVVEEFRQEIAYHYNLRKCALMLAYVLPGSFIITWYTSECIVGKLKENIPIDILKKYNTTKLEIAGDCVYEVSIIYP